MKRTLIAMVAAGVGLTALVILHRGWADAPAAPQNQPHLRHPLALALSDDGKQLFVGNRSGSISVIDVAKQRVEAEVNVGRKFSDLCAGPEGQVLAVDEDGHELLVLESDGTALKVVHRLAVAPYPVSVKMTAGRCFVSSLWSRKLTIIALAKNGPPKVEKTVDLPFAPRHLLPLPGTPRVVVADAFGGRVAVVNADKAEVESSRTLPAHNIRGLAIAPDGKELLLVHQVLNDKAYTTLSDVHWGNLMVNHLRSLRMADVLDPKADLIAGSQRHALGTVGRGAGDPSGLVVTADGGVLVTFGGVDELALAPKVGADWTRRRVGRRPSAVVVSSDGKGVFVANTFDDSVSVMSWKESKEYVTIALGPKPDLAAAERGELLFHDAGLSHDGWLSCQSCHTDGHTNGLLADTLGDGDFGAPKRVPTLHGVKDTGPWGWSGEVNRLSDQVRKSIERTMLGLKPSDDEVRDLTAYLESLPPLPRLDKDETALMKGREVFQKQGCVNCHTPPAFTSAKTFDVGLKDENGRETFNPPSLRGVGLGGPYFHDGRAATLEEVLGKHRHQIKEGLSATDQAELLRYLRGL